MTKEVDKKTEKETKFSKSQIISSNKFRHNTDLLRAMLTYDTEYTISEVEKMINKYLTTKL